MCKAYKKQNVEEKLQSKTIQIILNYTKWNFDMISGYFLFISI